MKKREMLKYVLVGALVVALLLSSYFVVYYYNSSKALAGRIQGATLEVARGFHFSLLYATIILESEAEPENIRALIRYFEDHIHSAIEYLQALRMYLLPSYEDSLLIIEDLLWYIYARDVSDTFHRLGSKTGVDAFKEFNLVASDKIFEMGHELAEAFESLRRDHTVQTFRIFPSRIENAVLIANDLKTILNEWVTKYSQMEG